jgi:hypothetical protein
MTRRRLVLSFCLVFAVFPTFAQQPVATNTQAVALASSALAALNGTTQVSDVTLTGTGTRTVGADVESGNFTLKALGDYQSRLDFVESAGTLSEVFNLSSNTPQGFWLGTDGTQHPVASHNCLAGEVWFFPSLSVLAQASSTNYTALYVGLETKNGVSVQHIQIVPQSSAVSAVSNQMLAQIATTDVYLDSSSYLPVAIAFSTHPDDNANLNIPVEIDFSNYQNVQGVSIPFHVQKLMNGSLLLDLTVQSAQVNTGLTSAVFSSN